MAKRESEQPRCLDCGYVLHGLSDKVCPECGRYFDLADTTTYRSPSSHDWRRWAKPPPVWHGVTMLVATLAAIVDFSSPGFAFVWGGCFFLVVLLLCVFMPMSWVARLVATYLDRDRARFDRGTQGLKRRWTWFATPVCFLVVLSTVVYPWPMAIRFRLSRTALEQAAAASGAGRLINTDAQWIGLYRVDWVIDEGDGRVGFATGAECFGLVGFVYDPAGKAADKYTQGLAPGWSIGRW